MANLPERNTTHDQEQRSLLKLSNALPKELFIMRKEGDADGCTDYGVDIVLELRQETKYVTNHRIQLQLKDVQNASRNTDRTFSYPIKLSTLNYLMNQPNSIFVIYLENEDILTWEWISEIFQATQAANIDIETTEQQTFSYRFTKELNLQSFTEIHTIVLRRGQLFRNVSEFISTASKPEQSNAAILLRDGKIHDIDETAKAIKQGGLFLVNAGHVGLINNSLDTLPSCFKSDPEISLVYAYVKFRLGFTLEALSWLPKGHSREKLSADKQAFVFFIELNLQFSLGILSREQYVERLLTIEQNHCDSIVGLQVKLERIRRSINNNGTDGIKGFILEMEETIRELLQKDTSSPTRIYAEIFAWELEGWQLISDMGISMSTQKMRFTLGHPTPLQERLKLATELMGRNMAWMGKYRQFLEQSKDTPSIYGQVVVAASTIMLRLIAQGRMDKDRNYIDDKDAIINVLDVIGFVYPQLLGQQLHTLALRVRLLEADALEGLGESKKAQVIAQEAYDASVELGLNDIQNFAEDFLSGEGIFSSAKRIKAELSVSDDEMLLDTSNDEISKMAQHFMTAMGLPDTRLDNIIKEYNWLKQDAECHNSFCTHLHTLQNLEHAQSTDTMYKVDPPRILKCSKYGFESDIESTDRNSLFSLFTWNYCNKGNCKEPAYFKVCSSS